MSAIRQSRGNKTRRITSPATPQIRQMMYGQIISVVGQLLTVELLIQSLPPVASPPTAPVQLVGIPQIARSSTGAFPTAATLDGGGTRIILTYPGASLGASEMYRVGVNDPAVRTYSGGYMAPGVLAPLPPSVTVQTYTASVVDGSTVLLQFGGGVVASLIVQLGLAWSLSSPGGQAAVSAYDTAADTVTLTATGAVVSTETVTYQGFNVTSGPSGTQVPSRDPVAIV